MSDSPKDPTCDHQGHSHLHDWTGLSTSERDKLLDGFCKQGMTSSQIALQFVNCSRNAVVGRVHRLQAQGKNIRLGGYQHNSPRGKKKEPSATRAKVTKPSPRVIENPEPPARTPERDGARAARPSVAPSMNPASADVSAFMDQLFSPALTANQKRDLSFTPLPGTKPTADPTTHECRWPVNGTFGSDPLHCGLPSAPLGYCETHRQIAYIPRNPNKEVRRGANS